jgi:hypothetical protein
MNSWMGFCLYVAAGVFIQDIRDGTPNPMSKDNLEFLLYAMKAIGNRHSITQHFTAQVEIDMASSGVGSDAANIPSRYFDCFPPGIRVNDLDPIVLPGTSQYTTPGVGSPFSDDVDSPRSNPSPSYSGRVSNTSPDKVKNINQERVSLFNGLLPNGFNRMAQVTPLHGVEAISHEKISLPKINGQLPVGMIMKDNFATRTQSSNAPPRWNSSGTATDKVMGLGSFHQISPGPSSTRENKESRHRAAGLTNIALMSNFNEPSNFNEHSNFNEGSDFNQRSDFNELSDINERSNFNECSDFNEPSEFRDPSEFICAFMPAKSNPDLSKAKSVENPIPPERDDQGFFISNGMQANGNSPAEGQYPYKHADPSNLSNRPYSMFPHSNDWGST